MSSEPRTTVLPKNAPIPVKSMSYTEMSSFFFFCQRFKVKLNVFFQIGLELSLTTLVLPTSFPINFSIAIGSDEP